MDEEILKVEDFLNKLNLETDVIYILHPDMSYKKVKVDELDRIDMPGFYILKRNENVKSGRVKIEIIVFSPNGSMIKVYRKVVVLSKKVLMPWIEL